MLKNDKKFMKRNLSENSFLKSKSNSKYDSNFINSLFNFNNNKNDIDNNFPILPKNNNKKKNIKKRSSSSKINLKIKKKDPNKVVNLNKISNSFNNPNNKGDIIDIKRNYEINEINRNLEKTKPNFNFSNSKTKDKELQNDSQSKPTKYKIKERAFNEPVKIFKKDIYKTNSLSKNDYNQLIKNNIFIKRIENGIKNKSENLTAFKNLENFLHKNKKENKEELFNSKLKIKLEIDQRLSNNKYIQTDIDQKEHSIQKSNDLNRTDEDERMTASKEINDNNNFNDFNIEKYKGFNKEKNDIKFQMKDELTESEEQNDNMIKKKEEIEKNKIQEDIKEGYKIKFKKNEELIKEINKLKRIIEILKKEKDDNNKFEIKKINELEEKNKTLISDNEELKKENEFIKQKNNDVILKYKKLKNRFNDIKITYEEIQKNDPLKLYITPTLIGLNNIGATCFMNSTLQCLSQTKDLTNYFLKQKYLENIGNNDISLKNKGNCRLYSSYLELIQKLWEKKGPKSYSPTEFLNIVNEINPLFKTGQAGDAKDFIIFVLEQLHKELKVSLNSNNSTDSEPLNQYDKNNALNYFFKDFKSQVSIISDIFYGFNETTNECLNCKNILNFKGLNNPICYNYGIFNCLIFPLEEVKNFKINNNCQFNTFQINNCVSIYDCFQFNQKTELFTGENRNYCNICQQLYDSYYTSKIYICPTVLIIILNRGKGNIYNIKLFFDEIIDVTEFVLQKEKSKIIYYLYGVITHIGQSGPNAHFVASCKSPIDNKWYRYNDSIVNPIEDVQKEIIDFGTPYILFYQKI